MNFESLMMELEASDPSEGGLRFQLRLGGALEPPQFPVSLSDISQR